MHENHCNAHIKESRIIGNRGNAYLSLYKTGGIDSLTIADNQIKVDRGMAIFVDANHSEQRPGPCRHVTIRNNVTEGGGIKIAGRPASDNRVIGNRHTGEGGIIQNQAEAKLQNNENYSVEG
jgi:hypothetical protein